MSVTLWLEIWHYDLGPIIVQMMTIGRPDLLYSQVTEFVHYALIWRKCVWINIRLFKNLQQIDKVVNAFCWHNNFVPKRLSALGLYAIILCQSIYNSRTRCQVSVFRTNGPHG